ncbi:MAG: TIGR02444 family protein [Maricaulaceae bacterium]
MAEGDFWRWSTAVYARKAVRDACLMLQNQHGLPVNALLWGAWLAHEGQRPTDAMIAEALALSAAWNRAVTASLRAAREGLKSPPAEIPADPARDLRQSVLRVELEAERLEQAALEALRARATAVRRAPAFETCAETLARLAAAAGRADAPIDVLAGAVLGELAD